MTKSSVLRSGRFGRKLAVAENQRSLAADHQLSFIPSYLLLFSLLAAESEAAANDNDG